MRKRALRWLLSQEAVPMGHLSDVTVAAILTSIVALTLGDAPRADGQIAERTKPLFVLTAATHWVAVNGNNDGPGTPDRPWATINHAAEQARPGDTIVVRGGHYRLPAQVRLHSSGNPGAWISFVAYPGETPILDAAPVKFLPFNPGIGAVVDGAFQIENTAYVRVIGLTVINSHQAGFTIRDSSHIDLINNSTSGSFGSGIAVWDTTHRGRSTRYIRILGNTITKATTWDLAPPDVQRRGEPPHEALSIAGAVDFEVAFNRVSDSDKEGIDIKETSKRGIVHHNLVENVKRQGIYIDAWFGSIDHILMYSNVVDRCGGAGIVLSVENGDSDTDIDIRNNLIFGNDGSGLLFSRWGVNNLRRKIRIANNIFYHNGYGKPAAGQEYFWIVGGIYLYSTNIQDISIEDNILRDNRGFQIGYSELYRDRYPSWAIAAKRKHIRLLDNIIDGPNAINHPIVSGGDPIDRVKIYAITGERPAFRDSMFRDSNLVSHPLLGLLRMGAPGRRYSSKSWWKAGFPPKLFVFRVH